MHIILSKGLKVAMSIWDLSHESPTLHLLFCEAHNPNKLAAKLPTF